MATMRSAQYVYYGPSTSTYPSVGSVSSGESISVLWQEGSWYHIQYSVTGTGQYKRGYVPTSTVSGAGTVKTLTAIASNAGTRYVGIAASTYTGPSTSTYPAAGSLSRGEAVSYLGYKENNFAFIEYSITGTSQKKRAYYYANNLATAPTTGGTTTGGSYTVGQRPSGMNINGSCYMSQSNIYYNAGLVGQCTWFCWGRALEKCGKYIGFSGNNDAKDWYANAVSGYSRKVAGTATPIANSIACFKGSTYGHVVFIEAVDGNYVYFTEANNPADNALSSDDGTVRKKTISEFKTHTGKTLAGYLVL